MRPLWLPLLLASASLVAGPLLGCGDDGPGDGSATSGRRVALATRLEAADPGAPFTTGLGWRVTLTRAALATGSFYYFDGPPPFGLAPPPGSPPGGPRRPRRSRWASLLGPSLAWAHPGHYTPGTARGQVLAPWSADLFAGPTDLPPGDGITGVVRSGRFTLAAATDGPAAGALGGQAALAAGAAEKDGVTVFFEVSASFDAVSARAAEGRVEGCVFEQADIQGDGTVTARVSPSVWFNLVDFSGLAPGSASAPTVITPADGAHLGFVTGLAQLSAYRFVYTAR